MARRRKMRKGTKTLILVAGLGVGGYFAYQAGLFHAVGGWLGAMQAPGSGGGGSAPGGNGGSTPSDGVTLDLGGIVEWIKGLFSGDGGGGGNGGFDWSQIFQTLKPDPCAGGTCPTDGETQPFITADQAAAGVVGLNLPGWLGGVPSGGATLPASRIPEALFKIAAPLWVGGSDAAAQMVHNVNVAIPGPNTGLEKGNLTLMSDDGPFIYRTATKTCHDLAGRQIICPDAVGIEQHTLDWYEGIPS